VEPAAEVRPGALVERLGEVDRLVEEDAAVLFAILRTEGKGDRTRRQPDDAAGVTGQSCRTDELVAVPPLA
jgi:hypothetical protein